MWWMSIAVRHSRVFAITNPAIISFLWIQNWLVSDDVMGNRWIVQRSGSDLYHLFLKIEMEQVITHFVKC